MKRISFLFILMLLACAGVAARALNIEDSMSSDKPEDTLPEKDIATNFSEGIRETREKIDAIPEKQIAIPEYLQKPTKIFFKIENGDQLNLLVISLMLAVLFYFFYVGMMESFSPLGNGSIYGISFALVIISAAIGIIRWAASTLIKFGGFFSFLENWAFAQFIILIVIIALFWLPISKLLKWLRKERGQERAREEGIKSGGAIGYAEAQRSFIRRLELD